MGVLEQEFIKSVIEDKIDSVKYLIKNGTNIDVSDNDGCTALLKQSLRKIECHGDTVCLLLKNGQWLEA